MSLAFRILAALAMLALSSQVFAAFDCSLVEGKEGGDRIPLIFYAVGYTQADKARYEADVEEAIDTLLNTTPYREYREHFTFYRAWTPSSKQDLPSAPSDSTFAGIYVDPRTGLLSWPDVVFYQSGSDSSYSCSGRGQDFTGDNPGVLLMNSDYSGGVAFQFRWAAASRGNPNVMLHELGHALAFLSDEYAYNDKRTSTTWDAGGSQMHPVFNVWRNLSRDSIPWKAWLDDSVPIPTPATAAYADRIGVFEGADYQSVGRYRPTLTCRMRVSRAHYCAICREALTWRFLSFMGGYSGHRVSLDTVFPAAGRLSGGKVVVRRVPGDTVPVSLRWRFNGAWLNGVRETLDVATLPGDGMLEAVLEGTSPFIRNPDLIPRDTLRWTVRQSSSVVRNPVDRSPIRRGPSVFVVRTTDPHGHWARTAGGRRVPLRPVARIAEGWILQGGVGWGEVLFLEPR